MHAEFAKALNDMRKNNEPVEQRIQSRARSINDVSMSQGNEFTKYWSLFP